MKNRRAFVAWWLLAGSAVVLLTEFLNPPAVLTSEDPIYTVTIKTQSKGGVSSDLDEDGWFSSSSSDRRAIENGTFLGEPSSDDDNERRRLRSLYRRATSIFSRHRKFHTVIRVNGLLPAAVHADFDFKDFRDGSPSLEHPLARPSGTLVSGTISAYVMHLTFHRCAHDEDEEQPTRLFNGGIKDGIFFLPSSDDYSGPLVERSPHCSRVTLTVPITPAVASEQDFATFLKLHRRAIVDEALDLFASRTGVAYGRLLQVRWYMRHCATLSQVFLMVGFIIAVVVLVFELALRVIAACLARRKDVPVERLKRGLQVVRHVRTENRAAGGEEANGHDDNNSYVTSHDTEAADEAETPLLHPRVPAADSTTGPPPADSSDKFGRIEAFLQLSPEEREAVAPELLENEMLVADKNEICLVRMGPALNYRSNRSTSRCARWCRAMPSREGRRMYAMSVVAIMAVLAAALGAFSVGVPPFTLEATRFLIVAALAADSTITGRASVEWSLGQQVRDEYIKYIALIVLAGVLIAFNLFARGKAAAVKKEEDGPAVLVHKPLGVAT